MQYWENIEGLGMVCPPATASDIELKSVYRVVFSNPPNEEDFYSHFKLNKKKTHDVDDCEFSSCSLFITKKRALELASYPKIKARSPKIAVLDIPVGTGKSIIKERKNHIDFWPYLSFDFKAVVTSVETP